MDDREVLSWIRKAKLEKWDGLDLSRNHIARLPPEIGELENLSVLDVSQTGLLELPEEVCSLTNLRILKVRKNKLSKLPEGFGRLVNLMTLEISGNSIPALPAGIGKLQKLVRLHADSNQISELPKELGELVALEFLNVSDNKINDLPHEILGLEHLKELDLQSNPLAIPPEILSKKNDPQTILHYYYSTQQESGKAVYRSPKGMIAHPINEAKVLIVGQGSVGKTSLLQRILYDRFDQSQTKTEGIAIHQWTTRENRRNQQSPIKLNLWDFGGQEIMHATHQFFLTKRSLYLLVLDARLTQEENRVEYWLKIIQSFGGKSPVLIVGNKIDQHPLDIDQTGLRKKFPNIVGIIETSAATGLGIDALQAQIAKQVHALPHVHDLLPEAWFTVKSKIEDLARNRNFFTQDEYLNICESNTVNDEISQRTLIGFLHDLGIVLHFQDDARLESLGILNPQWVTNGVYKILNSHELFQNQGKLTLTLLNQILNLPEYPSGKRLFIVDMMKKFELCYDIEPDKCFLVPDLLPKNEIYTGDWEDALAFQYHYSVLPSSILTRFIVRMNSFIHKNTIWRSGVVLKHGANTSLVKADIEERKIFIWVSGKEDSPRDLLAIIRGEFDAIHKTIAKLEVTEKVPLPNAPSAAPVDLAFLRKLASEGRESLPVQVGDQIVDLIVKEVLSRIETKGSITVNIGGNVGGNFILGDENKSNTQ